MLQTVLVVGGNKYIFERLKSTISIIRFNKTSSRVVAYTKDVFGSLVGLSHLNLAESNYAHYSQVCFMWCVW
jgi:hypothetical protein